MSNKSRRNRTSQQSGNPARRAAGRPQPKVGRATRSEPVAPATGARRTLEQRTGPLLVLMHGLPRWVVPVTLALALFFGLLLNDSWAWLGATLLFIISAFLGWLLALSWPMLSGGSRFIRLVVVLAVFGVAVLKVLGKW